MSSEMTMAEGGQSSDSPNPHTAASLPPVYVLDDDVQVLRVLELQLQSAGYTVRTFQSPDSFLAAIPELTPGILITDQRMPGQTGLSVQQQLVTSGLPFSVILISGFPETQVIVDAVKSGAVTVMDKPYDRNMLLQAVNQASLCLNYRLADSGSLPPVLPAGQRYLDLLSHREREVVDGVYKGRTNKALSISLNISIKTVEKHRGKAMKKMMVNSIAELVRLVDREHRCC